MKLVEKAYVTTNIPEDWSPYYIYSIIVQKEVVGTIVLRTGSNEEHYFDGHIGYTIDARFQGHHYAYYATKLVLKKAKEKGYNSLIITCSPDNISSKKTIQKLGARYLETKEVPKKIAKYFAVDETIKEIYEILL